MKINQIVPVKFVNTPTGIKETGYTSILIATNLELNKDTQVNTAYNFSNLEEVKAKTTDSAAEAAQDVLAAAELYFLNGGGKLKIFVVDAGESGANLSNPISFIESLLASREYFDVCMFTHSRSTVNSVITSNNIASLANALKVEGKMFAHTVNENEYDDFKAAVSLDFAHLSFATALTQSNNLKNRYMFLALSAPFGQINRSSTNDSTINVNYLNPIGLSKNTDITSEMLTKIETSKTLHVDTTEIGGQQTSVFFNGNSQSDGKTLTEVLINTLALQKSLQIAGFSLLNNSANKLKYNAIGFTRVARAAQQVLMRYSGAGGKGNGSLSPLSADQIDANDTLKALQSDQQSTLLQYGFAIITIPSSFNPSDDEKADQRFPEISIIINPSVGVNMIQFAISTQL